MTAIMKGIVKYRAGDRRPDDTPAVPPMVERCFKERGWIEWDEVNDDPRSWSVHWKSGRFKTNEYEHATPEVMHQLINHYPKTSPICVKDQMVRLMRRLRVTYGAAYDFFPQTYLLPNEYLKFVKLHAADTDTTESGFRRGDDNHTAKNGGGGDGHGHEHGHGHGHGYGRGQRKTLWICKPADSSRGRGIFIISDVNELEYDCNYVAQRYVDRPLLLSGYKARGGRVSVLLCITLTRRHSFIHSCVHSRARVFVTLDLL